MTNQKKKKKLKVRLLPHEVTLLAQGQLQDVTHAGASSKWLIAPSTTTTTTNNMTTTLCYRHLGDVELDVLLNTNQTLTRHSECRLYCESYLRQAKYVDTFPTTVVEFKCPKALMDDFLSHSIQNGRWNHFAWIGTQGGQDFIEIQSRLVGW